MTTMASSAKDDVEVASQLVKPKALNEAPNGEVNIVHIGGEVTSASTFSQSKFQRLGMQYISPGLSSENMDNKMLTTIRISKSIAREQRQHIEKLGSTVSNGSDSENINNENECNSNDDTPVISTVTAPFSPAGQSVSRTTLAKPRGKSLKRSKVPTPLDISFSNPLTMQQSSHLGNVPQQGATSARLSAHPFHKQLPFMGVESAPANITDYRQAHSRQQQQQQHYRVLKPKVQYMGKNAAYSNNLASRIHHYPSMQPYRRTRPLTGYPRGYMPIPPFSGYVATPCYPYVAHHALYHQQHQNPMLMGGYQGGIPVSAYPATAYPRLNAQPPSQTSAATAATALKSNNKPASNNKIQVAFENFLDRNRPHGGVTRDLFNNNTSRWAPLKSQPLSAQEDFFFARKAETEDPTAASSQVSAADASLNLENSSEKKSSTQSTTSSGNNSASNIDLLNSHSKLLAPRLSGEITIAEDTFAFEFSTMKENIDKKMFMSICSKVWDESRKLDSVN